MVSPKYSQVIRQQGDVEEGCQSSVGADRDLVSLPAITSYNIGTGTKSHQAGLSRLAGKRGRDMRTLTRS